MRSYVAQSLDPWPFLSLPQVIGGLYVEPGLGRTAEGRCQTYGQFCAHGRTTVNDARKRHIARREVWPDAGA